MSRISSTNGAPWARATGQPAQPAKNCGLVATTTSARGRMSGPAAPAAARYERKLRPRRTRPLLAASQVQTRTVRTPSIHSSW